MLPLAREFLQLVLRTNLMFFYFEGKSLWCIQMYGDCEDILKEIWELIILFSAGLYYHISKRAAGIRYVFIGKPMNQRPRYSFSKFDTHVFND